MKGKILILALVLVGLGEGFFLFGRSRNDGGPTEETFVTDSSEVTIRMNDTSYGPVNLKIKAGAKVTFVNDSKDYRWPASDLHPSHLIFPEFDSKEALPPGASWSFVFEKTGEWGYHDHLAPYITGTVTVVE